MTDLFQEMLSDKDSEIESLRQQVKKLEEALKQGRGEPFAYARYVGQEFHSLAKTTEGWGNSFCKPLYTSAPSIPEGWVMVPGEPVGYIEAEGIGYPKARICVDLPVGTKLYTAASKHTKETE